MSLIRALDKVSIFPCRRAAHSVFLFCLLLGLSGIFISCNSKKYLLPGQSFLAENKVKIRSKYKIPNKSELYDNLVSLYRQDRTPTVAGIPRHVFYYHYKESLLKHPERKLWKEEKLKKNEPVILDSLKAAQTCRDFESYLALRGYRFAHATFKTKTQDKQSTVYYHVDPGPRIYIDTFQIIAADPALQHIVDSVPREAILERKSPLDIELYNQERSRIVRLLQNQGYSTFDESYVSPLEVDTAHQRVKAVMRLHNPTDSTVHQKYLVGDITVYADYDLVSNRTMYDTVVGPIKFMLPDSAHFTIKPEAIERNIYLQTGELNRKDNLDRTIRSLARVELIKFVTPSAFIDTARGQLPEVDYSFFLSRNKKIDFQGSLELTYSNVATYRQKSLFGTAASLGYRDRNLFGGAEVFNFNFESGFEFNFANRVADENGNRPSFINSVNLGLGANVTFPRFMDPVRLYHMIGYKKDPDKKPLIGGRLRRWLDNDAVTRLGLAYGFVNVAELYKYYNITANLSYVMQPSAAQKLTIDRLGFDLFVPFAKPAFDSILAKNTFQRESFGKQLYTGLLFRDYLAETNTKTWNKRGYFRIIQGFEISGLEVLGLNQLVNVLNHNHKEFIIVSGKGEERDTVKFSHFIKAELDLRYYYDFSQNTQLAFRFNTGLAFPFGPFTKQVPYPKQFFVGGALSNRAWQIRELGPGGYRDTTPVDPNLPFYQTGDVKIDLSLELRFKLFWYLKGGIFIDASNVWTLYDDPERPLSNFKWNRFLEEFGVGYGYGLRFDFNYFLFRFDLGYKLFSPYEVDGKHFLKDAVKKFPGGAELQFAIGHKF